MASDDKASWIKAVNEEHDTMVKHDVWTPVLISSLLPNDKIITTTWAMKKKPNGRYRARLNARGYEQIEGVHFDENSTSAPVTNDTTIRIMLTLANLVDWSAYVIDVQGAFLNGRFEAGERLFLHIPDGFKDRYNSNCVLKLNRTIY